LKGFLPIAINLKKQTPQKTIKMRNLHKFFVLGVSLILSLMGMGSPYQKKKIVRYDTILTYFNQFSVR
ncbi:hypothetical protein, partial [Bacillus pseudomycoides]|uniref:hypothetical protein n=1 Tax=Bacillus pseudomycoides TaxID=64104 RepID=UPI001C55866A